MRRFEWDESKNADNRRKHGIGFEEAAAIFDGPILTRLDDRSYEEIREISFGFLGAAVVVAVVHTDRDGAIRIVSARKATKRERSFFYASLERPLS